MVTTDIRGHQAQYEWSRCKNHPVLHPQCCCLYNLIYLYSFLGRSPNCLAKSQFFMVQPLSVAGVIMCDPIFAAINPSVSWSHPKFFNFLFLENPHPWFKSQQLMLHSLQCPLESPTSSRNPHHSWIWTGALSKDIRIFSELYRVYTIVYYHVVEKLWVAPSSSPHFYTENRSS